MMIAWKNGVENENENNWTVVHHVQSTYKGNTEGVIELLHGEADHRRGEQEDDERVLELLQVLHQQTLRRLHVQLIVAAELQAALRLRPAEALVGIGAQLLADLLVVGAAGRLGGDAVHGRGGFFCCWS